MTFPPSPGSTWRSRRPGPRQPGHPNRGSPLRWCALSLPRRARDPERSRTGNARRASCGQAAPPQLRRSGLSRCPLAASPHFSYSLPSLRSSAGIDRGDGGNPRICGLKAKPPFRNWLERIPEGKEPNRPRIPDLAEPPDYSYSGAVWPSARMCHPKKPASGTFYRLGSCLRVECETSGLGARRTSSSVLLIKWLAPFGTDLCVAVRQTRRARVASEERRGR